MKNKTLSSIIKNFPSVVSVMLLLCFKLYAIEKHPNRIVSLGPEITQKLFELTLSKADGSIL
ncbi:hypothetical protein ACFLTD_02285 [Elusimicrobiota bacterium]